MNNHPFLMILLLALPVWVVRLGGYYLAGHIKLGKKMMLWLECLPGCILMAIVAPLLITTDWVIWLAAMAVAIVMWKTNRLLYAMVAGMLVAAIGHALF